MTQHPLHLGIGDAGLKSSLEAVARLALFRDPPLQVEVDEIRVPVAEWPDAMLAAKRDARADWFAERVKGPRARKLVTVNPRSERVTFVAPEAFKSVEDALVWIEQLPFHVCSIGPICSYEWIKMDVENFGFSNRHVGHGWACAFRGPGHDRLVSRRWLDFGPWRVVRRPGDLSLVQFHDLEVDPTTAAAQALPGHERMGISEIGGYLQMPYPFTKDVEGLYAAESRTLEIIVPPGDKVDQVYMQDACAVRYQHRVSPPAERPIDHIAYVFLHEDDARAHLHELWLRELEVWVADGDGKRRLDLDYRPTPSKPAWVTALDAADAP